MKAAEGDARVGMRDIASLRFAPPLACQKNAARFSGYTALRRTARLLLRKSGGSDPDLGHEKSRADARLFSWLGMRDSNPRSWDQNPLPYHLANPQ